MALKWKRGDWVISISCLVPHRGLIDLPRYMSDQISGESALTSAFGISRLSAFFRAKHDVSPWISGECRR